MILVWIVIAMLPIAIVSLLSTLLIRLSSLWKHRDMIATVGGIIFLVAYFYLAGTIGGLTGDASAGGDMIMQFMAQNTARIDALTRMFPPASWAAKGLLGDWGMLLLFIRRNGMIGECIKYHLFLFKKVINAFIYRVYC